ncbi:MAG: MgtC/SapB family protein [bacterium]|nr:MgtC/SapB family protein [bacterium]
MLETSGNLLPTEYVSFGLAILLGALIGTERQFAAGRLDKSFGGIRTFVFVALGGAIAAFIDDKHIPGFFLLAFAGTSLLVLSSHLVSILKGGDEGTTTEMVSPLVFGLGGLCWWEHYHLALALVIAILFFLSSKRLLHQLTTHLSYEDIRASVTLLVIIFIVLPIVPNKGMGPYEALNPYRLWLFVVLVSLLSFSAYVALKMFSKTLGVIVTGVLGGIVSSTAATMTLAKHSQEQPDHSETFATSAIIASATMPIRAVVLTIVVVPQYWAEILPIAIPGLIIGAYISLRLVKSKSDRHTSLTLNNPFRLMVALNFGLLFAAATFFARLAVEFLGDRGVVLVAALSGSVSVDAAVLSLGEFAVAGLPSFYLTAGVAAAILANCILKAGIAAVVGTPVYRKKLVPILLVIGVSSLLPLLWNIF